MMALIDVSEYLVALVVGMYIITFTFMLILLVSNFFNYRLKVLRGRFTVMMLLTIFLTITAIDGQLNIAGEKSLLPLTYYFVRLPVSLHFIFVLGFFVYSIKKVKRQAKLRPNILDSNSIKKAIDNLPHGLAFSSEKGMPSLTNHKIHDLSERITGHHFRNAEEFWDELTNLKVGCLESGEDTKVILVGDGEVWRFTRSYFAEGGFKYRQIVASDISEMYNLAKNLNDDNEILKMQYQRLKKLLDDILKIKEKEEIIASKVKIHSELGRCIVAGNTIKDIDDDKSEKEEKVDRVLQLWERTIIRLEGSLDDEEEEESLLKQIHAVANVLRCPIHIRGELPQNSETQYLILIAVKEALTNAVKHGEAGNLYVNLREEGGEILIEICDDGKGGNEGVREGGGLTTLRKKIEQRGGTMFIEHKGGSIKLLLKLKTGEDEEETWSML